MRWLLWSGWLMDGAPPWRHWKSCQQQHCFGIGHLKNLVADESRWDAISDFISKKSGNKNAKVYVDETLVLQIQGLGIDFRQSICDIAVNTSVSIGNIQSLVKKELLKNNIAILSLFWPMTTSFCSLHGYTISAKRMGNTTIWYSMSKSLRSGSLWWQMEMATTSHPQKNKNTVTFNTKSTWLKLCFYLPLPNLASSHSPGRCWMGRLASGHLPKNAPPLATARINRWEQWNGIMCWQIKKRYARCWSTMSFLPSTESGLLVGDGRQFFATRQCSPHLLSNIA